MYDVVIVDGNNMANKAFFLNSNLSCVVNGVTYKTGVLYGLLSMMSSVVKAELIGNDTLVFFVWDTPVGSDVRSVLLGDYKAQRVVTDEDRESKKEFYHQTELAKKELFNFRFYQAEQAGLEADDIIAELVKSVTSRNSQKSILIISEDKDFRSLISEKVHLYSVSARVVWDIDYFVKKTGLFLPEYFTDYLALAGDASDNYSGVKGIGDKTARAIINDTLFREMCIGPSPVRAILESPDLVDQLDISDRAKKLLHGNMDTLRLNYQLASFVDVPEVKLKFRDNRSDAALQTMLDKYKMKSFLTDEALATLQILM